MTLGKQSAPEASDLKPSAAITVVARDTVLTGEIEGSRAVRIEGTLKGSVKLRAPVDVAEGAVVQGDVDATVVRVAGKVSGDIRAAALVELLATASVTGDVHTPALHVFEGATLDGKVQMHHDDSGRDSAGQAAKGR